MAKRKKFIALSLLLSGMVVTGLVWFLTAPVKPSPTWTLSDGSTVRFLKVTYGTDHHYIYGNRLLDNFYPFVPARFRTNFNFRAVSLPPTPSGSVVLWLERHGRPPPPLPPSGRTWAAGIFNQKTPVELDLEVFDAAGVTTEAPKYVRMGYDVVRQSRFPLFWIFKTGTNELEAFPLDHPPPRAESFGIRLKGTDLDDTRTIAEFQVANPKPRLNAPAWPVETIPATHQTNKLEVSLVKFDVRCAEAELAFDLRENGTPMTDWQIVRITAGNGLGREDILYPRNFENIGQPDSLHVKYPFWSSQPVWELKVKVARIVHFSSEQTWKISGIPVPPGTGSPFYFLDGVLIPGVTPTLSMINLSTNLLGKKLSLVGASRDSGMWARAGETGLNVTLSFEKPAALWLTALNAADDLGRSVRPKAVLPLESETTPVPGKPPRASFRFETPANSKSVDAAFGISPVFEFEFHVKPALKP